MREISLIKPSFGRNQFKDNFTLIHELFSSIIYIYLAIKQARKMRNKENDDGATKPTQKVEPFRDPNRVICKQMNLFITLAKPQKTLSMPLLSPNHLNATDFSAQTRFLSLSPFFSPCASIVFSGEFNNKDPRAFRSSMLKLAHTNCKPEYYNKQCNEKRRLKCDK